MISDEKIAAQITRYIRNNLDKRLDILSVCKQFQISKSTLEGIFNEVYDQPVHHFILLERLQKGLRLISETNLPIKKIASLCGFHSATTFTRKFKQYFGMTPAASRKRIENTHIGPFLVERIKNKPNG